MPRPLSRVAALLPFGAHKGYAMCLVNELYAGLIGGSLPTLRGRPDQAGPDEKTSTAFYFQVIHPEALSGGAFAAGRNQGDNLKAVLDDILGHGNESCILPGQFEAEARQRSDAADGLHFATAELDEFNALAAKLGEPGLEAL